MQSHRPFSRIKYQFNDNPGGDSCAIARCFLSYMKLPSDFSPESRGDAARDYFLRGYNCCQAVLLAFADVLEENGMADSGLLKVVGSGFGGGMARMREVCGSFSADVILAGFLRPASSTVREDRAANYALVQEMADGFRELNGGSIVCRDLLGLGQAGGRGTVSPVPSERTADFYRRRPCPEIIRNSAIVAARKMLELSGE